VVVWVVRVVLCTTITVNTTTTTAAIAAAATMTGRPPRTIDTTTRWRTRSRVSRTNINSDDDKNNDVDDNANNDNDGKPPLQRRSLSRSSRSALLWRKHHSPLPAQLSSSSDVTSNSNPSKELSLVLPPAIRLDRTMTLRTALSRDELSTASTENADVDGKKNNKPGLLPVLSIDDTASQYSSIKLPPLGKSILMTDSREDGEQKSEYVDTSTIATQRSLDTIENGAIIASYSTASSIAAEGYNKMKKRLRSKVLKTKMDSLCRNSSAGNSVTSLSPLIEGGARGGQVQSEDDGSALIATENEKSRRTIFRLSQKSSRSRVGQQHQQQEQQQQQQQQQQQSLRKNSSRGLSIRSETSTLQTPKITNKANAMKKNFFASVDEENALAATSDNTSFDSNSDILAMKSSAIDSTTNTCRNDMAHHHQDETRQDKERQRSGESWYDQDESTLHQEESRVLDEETTSRYTARTDESNMPMGYLMDLFNCKPDELDNMSLATGHDDASLSTMGFPSTPAYILDYCGCVDLCTRRNNYNREDSGGVGDEEPVTPS
jgi:hypothetical protein